MQFIARFGTDESIYRSGNYYRNFIIKLADGQHELHDLLFWRNEHGQEITDRPDIRWLGGKYGFHLVSHVDHKNIIMQIAMQLNMLFLAHSMKCQTSFSEQPIDAIESDDICEYYLNNLVIDRSARAHDAFLKQSTEEKQLDIERYVREQLIEEARLWGVDSDIFAFEHDSIRINALEEKPFPIKLGNSAEREQQRIRPAFKCKLYMPIQLTGRWQVGKLLSKGYGVISPAMR